MTTPSVASPASGVAGSRFAVVGNPENRRVSLFADAVRAAGLAGPRVVAWSDVLLEGGADFASDEIVRVDSPGENPEVDRLLRGATDPTRVEGSARWYARFTGALRTLRGGIRLDDPDDLAVLFDKRACHGVLDAAGVPVPASPTSGPGGAPVRGWDDVRALMREHRMPRLFVKPAHGSSASGVLAVEAGGGRIRATTSVELAPGGALHNSFGCVATTASGTSPPSSTRSHPMGCTWSAGYRRRPSTAGPPTCAWSWWPGGPRTPWSAPVERR